MVKSAARAASLTSVAAVILAAAVARAAPISEAECVGAHRQAQIDRKARALMSAVENLRRCADAACPKLIESDCAEWLVETERALPSIVVVATGPGGDVQDVRVSIDGNLLVARITGGAIDVDPGEHRFRFELAGEAPIERTLVVREGEQRRRIEVAFGAAATRTPDAREERAVTASAVPDQERAGAGPWPYALGAVGIVGVGGFAFFGYRGLRIKSELDDQNCKPACSQARVDEGNRQFLIADISLGVGVAALGAATYLWLSSREPEPSAMRVEASPRGAYVAWRARF
jgi:hypothetical protein